MRTVQQLFSHLLLLAFAVYLTYDCPVARAFSSQLAPPWGDPGPGGNRVIRAQRRRRRKRRRGESSPEEERKRTSLISSRPSCPSYLYASSSNNDNEYPPEDEEEEERRRQSSYEDAASSSPRMFGAADSISKLASQSIQSSDVRSSKQRVNGAAYEAAPNVWNSLGSLFQLTRPSNFPGIILFHMLGVYLALSSSQTPLQAGFYWKTLLTQPTTWLTLAALILTSSTSMVVNDYYDAKLGRDMDKHKALADGDIPLHVARRFLSYLYSAALCCVAFLPGAPTRLAVISGLMLTYWYTQHLKPITWLKNAVCASLIALSPLTSGWSTLHLLHNTSSSGKNLWSLFWKDVAPLWRLFAILFFGVLGREIMMDCNDVANDRRAQVRTVPVVYGRRFASGVSLVSMVIMAAAAMSGPVLQLLSAANSGASSSFATTGAASTWDRARQLWVQSSPAATRRFALAGTGSAMVIRRGWRVFQTEGADKEVVDRAVEEGLITILFFLASFI